MGNASNAMQQHPSLANTSYLHRIIVKYRKEVQPFGTDISGVVHQMLAQEHLVNK